VRRGAVAAALAAAIVFMAVPAHALETRSFGLTPGKGASTEPGTERLVVRPSRGGTSRTTVEVSNRTANEMRVQLSTEAAEVDGSGKARLGGDARAAGWITPSESTIELAPRSSKTVELRVHVPRRAGGAERTAAIVAEPVERSGSSPAVIERLALVVYVRPGGDGGFGRWVAIAAAALVLAAAAVAASAFRRWREVRSVSR
jgi:hypothetical protein